MRIIADSFIPGIGYLCFGLVMLILALVAYVLSTHAAAGRDIDQDRK